MDVAPRDEILVPDLAGDHAGHAEDHVAWRGRGLQILDRVDERIAAPQERREGGLVGIDAVEVGQPLLVAARGAPERTRPHVADAARRLACHARILLLIHQHA